MSAARRGSRVLPPSPAIPPTAPSRTSASAGGSARSGGVATVVVAVLLVAATVAFAWLQVQADRERQIATRLARIDTSLQRMNALEWRLTAQHAVTPEVEWATTRAREEMSHLLAEMPPAALRDPVVARVIADYRVYAADVDREMDLERGGHAAEAEDFDAHVVDPSFAALDAALVDGGLALARRAQQAHRLALVTSLLAALLSLLALTWLAVDVGRRGARRGRSPSADADYRPVFETLPEPMWLLDPASGRFLAVNDAALALYGYLRETFLDLHFDDVWDAPSGIGYAPGGAIDPARLQQAREASHRRRDGSRIGVDVSTRAVTFDGRPALLAEVRDSGGRRRFEARVREAERLETMGRLTSGVAHDFNNLVTTIVGYTQLLMGELNGPAAATARGHAQEIWKAAGRATTLTQQILNFGRAGADDAGTLDLGALLLELEPLLPRLLGEDVRVAVRVAPGTWSVRGPRGVMEQLVLNLALNARTAMPRGGALTISVEPAARDTGAGVAIAFTDTGTALDAARCAALVNGGTSADALADLDSNLAAVASLVRECDGRLAVETASGAGGTLRVVLPLVSVPATAPAAEPAPSARGGRRATLLLVEDDPAVRDVIRLALIARGYEVIVCASAEHALVAASTHAGAIDLMITDVVMPGLNGRQLAERLSMTQPALKVLYISGYTDDHVVREGVQAAHLEFLAKPFELGALEARVAALLEAPRAVA